VAKVERQKRVQDALAMVRLPHVEGRKPAELSGGQQQRVALARALVNRPAVLLLDEPLGALDLKLRKAMQLELKQLNREVGATFVYVTHDQEEALSLSDRVVVMSEGRIEQIGPPPEIYNFPATPFVASFVGTLNLVQATVVDGETARLSVEGQEIRGARPGTGSGQRVTVALRPEAVEIGESGGSNRLRGTVEDVSFLGSIVRTRVRIGENETLSFDQFNDPSLAASTVGDTITVSFSPDSTLVLEGRASADAVIEQAIAES
jgi:putative spermidine/putrescine transport system ATP-binding protein